MSDSESRPMFCASCGKPTTPDAKFCKNCGAQTDGGQQTAPSVNDAASITEKPKGSRRAGKWVLIGVAGLIGLVVLLGAAGVLTDKTGWKVPNAQTASTESATPVEASAARESARENTPLISAVRNGTIEAYPSVPIGKAFDTTFDNPQWRSDESEKGVKFVEFNGRLKSSKHKDAFDKALIQYHKCAADVDEVRRMPNYSFTKYLAEGNFGYHGTQAFIMAQANKGNEAKIAELYNSSTDTYLVEQVGKVGPGNEFFDKYVKEAGDIKRCGPGTEEELAAVRFQFEFTPDTTSFSLAYIDLEPWKRIDVFKREAVLEYVFR